MKAILSTILVLIVTYSPVVATKQRSDFLEYQSQVFEFGHNGATPLVDYFKKFDIDPPNEFRAANTNLDRGHIAHWRVYNGKLWLVSIYMPSHSDEHSRYGREALFLDLWLFPLERVFPDRGQIVHADWFTGALRVFRHREAKILNGKPLGGDRVRILEFREGVLVDRPASKEQSRGK